MKNLERTLCYILRHKPQDFNLEMDKFGYVSTKKLIESLSKKKDFEGLNLNLLVDIVNSDGKGRYKLKDVNKFIKCQFGHSVKIKSENLLNKNIPDALLHGTKKENLESILKDGLKPMSRGHVHLTSDIEVANQVGMRYAKKKEDLEILKINSKKMIEDGLIIENTETTTYLTSAVLPEYIEVGG